MKKILQADLVGNLSNLQHVKSVASNLQKTLVYLGRKKRRRILDGILWQCFVVKSLSLVCFLDGSHNAAFEYSKHSRGPGARRNPHKSECWHYDTVLLEAI